MADIDDLKAELDQLSRKVDSARKKNGSNLSDNVSDKVQDYLDSAGDFAKKKGEDIHAYAKENPWSVAGIAAAVGLLTGLLVMKGSRNR